MERRGARSTSLLASLRAQLDKMGPQLRTRIAIGAGFVALAVVLFVACGAGKTGPGAGSATSGGGGSSTGSAASRSSAPDAGSRRDHAMWARAKEGIPEDLSTLAVHEGAMGLVEAAAEADLRPTALRAMAHARGWAQLPFLVRTAVGKNDDEAKAALESIVDLAARPRTSEDPEDAEELEEGCKGLLALGKDTGKDRARRVPAIRALRMMPCPKADVPTDLDTR